MTLTELAKETGISKSTLWRWCVDGKRISGRGVVFLKHSKIDGIFRISDEQWQDFVLQFTARLKSRRYSASEIAESLGISVATISRWINVGRKTKDGELVRLIADHPLYNGCAYRISDKDVQSFLMRLAS